MASTALELKKECERRSMDERIESILRAAVRAPSTHNSQPWLFKKNGTQMSILLDTAVKLPNSDPSGRHAAISIGFLLHHLAVLSRCAGLRADIRIAPEGAHMADVHFYENGLHEDVNPLADAVFRRRNRRGVFSPYEIPENVVAEMCAPSPYIPAGPVPQMTATSDRNRISEISQLTADSLRRVYKSPLFRSEMSRWIVPAGSRKRKGLPGYSLNLPVPITWFVPLIIRKFNVGDTLAKLSGAGISSSSGVFGIASGDTTREWLRVGMQASHGILTAVAHGFDVSIYIAAVESSDTRRQAGAVLSLNAPLQFVFVAGKLPGEVSWMTPRVDPLSKFV